MLIVIILVLVGVLVFLKMKKDRAADARFLQEETAWEQQVAARKKDGEPKVCTKMPSLEGKGKTVIGPDGKNYPKTVLEKNYYGVIRDFFREDAEDYAHAKYECSPLFCMAAMEYYILEYFYGSFDWGKPETLTREYVEKGISCIYEVAENYAYPAMQNNDMIQAQHYLVRRTADKKRAMEGNGYYKNVYEIPVNMDKALNFYRMPEKLREKYTDYVGQAGKDCVITMVKCWLQTAHIYSARQEAEKAKKLYSQVYQMAVRYSLDDMIMELIHALTSGYPRNPADYQDHAYNILADWACTSDLGLAMYVEYVLHINGLDKTRMAKSPEEAVKLYREQAESNHYAAYLLGQATLFGYGTAKDEAYGRRMIEIAAENGCIAALFALIQLSAESREESKKWQSDFEKTVAAVVAESGSVRDELKRSGKNVTEQRFSEIERSLAEAERKRQTEAAAETQEGFAFPVAFCDENLNRWERGDVLLGVARYQCMSTGEIRNLDRRDIQRLERTPGIQVEY